MSALPGWLMWILVGAVAGFLADLVIKGINLGLIGKIVVGILGGVLGGWIFDLLNLSIGSDLVNWIVSAFVGAVVLLLLLRLIRRK